MTPTLNIDFGQVSILTNSQTIQKAMHMGPLSIQFCPEEILMGGCPAVSMVQLRYIQEELADFRCFALFFISPDPPAGWGFVLSCTLPLGVYAHLGSPIRIEMAIITPRCP